MAQAKIKSADIVDSQITLAKMADVATSSLIGRSTAGTGVPEVITVGSGLTLSAGTLTASGGSSKWTDVGTGNIYRNSSVHVGGTSDPTVKFQVTGETLLGGKVTINPGAWANGTVINRTYGNNGAAAAYIFEHESTGVFRFMDIAGSNILYSQSNNYVYAATGFSSPNISATTSFSAAAVKGVSFPNHAIKMDGQGAGYMAYEASGDGGSGNVISHAFNTLNASTVSSSSLVAILNNGTIAARINSFGNIAAGGTHVPTAVLDAAASTTSAASLRLRSGTAPTSPNDGDIWFDGTDLKMRIGGVTKTFTMT